MSTSDPATMPPRSSKSSTNCCTGRTPPSPEGEPARLVILPTKSSHQQGNAVISSSSTVATEIAELRPIFQEDGNRCEDKVSVKVDKPHNKKVAPGERSETDDESEGVKARKNIHTLNSVKQKLKRHLSRDSTLAKRRSVSSVGTSEEEIGRRAELRRIRHKRIQDELSNEASYDEDARSLSIMDGDTTLAQTISASWVPGDPLPLPHLLSSSSSYPVFPFPDLAPVEEHNDSEESGEDNHDSRAGDQANKKAESATEKGVNRSKGSISRRHSSPILNESETVALNRNPSRFARKESVIAPPPPAPTLEPQRLPSISEPPRSSWRLSFVSQNRDEHLRKLSQEHRMPSPVAFTEPSKGHPVLQRWLQVQGLRASSNVMSSLDEGNTTVESLVSDSRSCPISPNVGGVDGGIEESVTMMPLHQMGISHRLMSSGTLYPSSSSPQLTSWGSHHRGGSSLSNATDLIRAERRKYLRKTSDSLALSEEIPKSWGKVLQDKRQRNSSVENSSLASPESSRLNLATLLVRHRGKLGTRDMSTENISGADTFLTTATTASDGSPCRPIQGQVGKTTLDDNSFIISDTESFREREAELSIVKARFASTEGSRCPSTPVSSRFREEFDLKAEPKDSPIQRRPSKFSRLTKFATRQHDGPSVGMEELLSIPIPDFMPSEQAKKKKAADEAWGGAWGESFQKKHRKKSKDNFEQKTVLGALGFMTGGHKKRKSAIEVDHKTAAAEYQEKFDDRLHKKELVMDSWEEEMAAISAKAKAKSRHIVKKKMPTGPDLRYPPNWARFPSHDRQERSTSAGRYDNVAAKDYAIKSVENGESTWYHHERKYHLYHYEGDNHPSHTGGARKKGIIEKAHNILKNQAYEYLNRGEPPEIEDSYGRRSSMNVEFETDFPELEILPMEIRTAAQMEQEVVAAMEEQKRLQALADTDMGTVDGSADSSHTSEMVGGINIADPKFYEDCIVTNSKQLSPQRSMFLPGSQISLEKVRGADGKYQTWNGKDWDVFRSLSTMSSGCGRGRRQRRQITLRKSTEDYHKQLQELEKAEREKVLGLAREVWGKKKVKSGKSREDMKDESDRAGVTEMGAFDDSVVKADVTIAEKEVTDEVTLLG